MSATARRQAWFLAVFFVVVVFFVVTFRMGVVRGESMTPSYADGQVVLVRRRNWFSGPLRRGDVVLMRKERDIIIKRIYRLPGEELNNAYPDVLAFTLRNRLQDYYEQETIPPPPGSSEAERIRYRVPEGYLVILGDNLNVSEDSRAFGPVPIRDVLGVVANPPPDPYAARPN